SLAAARAKAARPGPPATPAAVPRTLAGSAAPCARSATHRRSRQWEKRWQATEPPCHEKTRKTIDSEITRPGAANCTPSPHVDEAQKDDAEGQPEGRRPRIKNGLSCCRLEVSAQIRSSGKKPARTTPALSEEEYESGTTPLY